MTPRRHVSSNPLFQLLFGLWAWVVMVLFVLPAMVAVILAPGRHRRRALACASARGMFRLLGVRIRVTGLRHLPANCIVAINHASYLDGAVAAAALPSRFGFVIKREITKVPVVGWMLHRLGSEFVERFDKRGAHKDASRIIKRANQGTCLGIFPEGTFVAEPGLRSFHLGGFMAATRGGLPVVPVVIRGTRRMLPAHVWLMRYGHIEVEVLPAISPERRNGDAARRLRDAVRAEILAHCGEPDHRHHRPAGS
ncbi:MAG TPA: lysophospholipid acyltransferase family protein [Gammaproteobacteria bacterium]|nr:lysophospholipid acyltransferase family protein [Gammaproteobacteria bacterium]